MSKTIKVIDLLNKIANGEKTLRKFKYQGDVFVLDETDCYVELNDIEFFTDNINYDLSNLNDELELIEEQQDIDIANIQELKEMTYKEFKKELELPCITPKEVLLAKINEIIINQNTVIKAVKQLDKKIREER